MKIRGLVLICSWLLSTVPALAQADTDTCHVYVIDVKATQEFREKTDFAAFLKKSKQEQEAIMNAAGVGKTYEEFATKVEEEKLTTKSYPFPKARQVITASIFYTDESMRSTSHQDSMLLAISVAAKATDDALSAADAAITEISYDGNTDVVRVKKNIVMDGRLYIVGLECRCKQAVSQEKK
jgi:hypothetical protein